MTVDLTPEEIQEGLKLFGFIKAVEEKYLTIKEEKLEDKVEHKLVINNKPGKLHKYEVDIIRYMFRTNQCTDLDFLANAFGVDLQIIKNILGQGNKS
ncbi:MAG TPA: hypothetical protein VKR58_12475 [Aquella sp.]|nr:hypothetical protein [Aquella sp.]